MNKQSKMWVGAGVNLPFCAAQTVEMNILNSHVLVRSAAFMRPKLDF